MTHTAPPPPWYRQFWPWFLIALPATAVVAGISTLVIATYEPDGVVVDDYYKQGLAINQDLDRDHKAAQLALHARVQIHSDGLLAIALQGKVHRSPGGAAGVLLHPTKAGRDQVTVAQRAADGSSKPSCRPWSRPTGMS